MTQGRVFNQDAFKRKSSAIVAYVGKTLRTINTLMPTDYKSDIRYINTFSPIQQQLILNMGNRDYFSKIWVVNLVARNIGELVATTPIGLRDSKGNEIDIAANNIGRLVKRTPNRHETSTAYLTRVAIDLILTGNSYTWVFGPNDPAARPISMTPLLTRDIEAIVKHGVLLAYKNNATNKTFQIEEIIHVREYAPDSRFDGMSWLAAGALKLSRASKQDTYSNSVFTNGIFPSANFHTEQVLSPEQRAETYKNILEQFTGSLNAGGFLLTDKGVGVKPMSLSPAELEILESERVTAGNIASLMNYPPELIGNLLETKGVATYKEARRQLYDQAVIPLAGRILDAFNHYFFPEGDFTFFVNKTMIELFRPTAESLAASWWLTGNMKLAMQGLPASTDPLMDKYIIPSNMVLLDDIAFDGDKENL